MRSPNATCLRAGKRPWHWMQSPVCNARTDSRNTRTVTHLMLPFFRHSSAVYPLQSFKKFGKVLKFRILLKGIFYSSGNIRHLANCINTLLYRISIAVIMITPSNTASNCRSGAAQETFSFSRCNRFIEALEFANWVQANKSAFNWQPRDWRLTMVSNDWKSNPFRRRRIAF